MKRTKREILREAAKQVGLENKGKLLAVAQERWELLTPRNRPAPFVMQDIHSFVFDVKSGRYECMKDLIPTPSPSTTPVPSTTPSAVVREMLLQVPDPDTCETKKLWTMARVRCHQLGMDENRITLSIVRTVRNHIRQKYGAPITPEKIRAYNNGVRPLQPKEDPVKEAPLPPIKEETPVTSPVVLIRDLWAFSRRVGGWKALREMIDALEGG